MFAKTSKISHSWIPIIFLYIFFTFPWCFARLDFKHFKVPLVSKFSVCTCAKISFLLFILSILSVGSNFLLITVMDKSYEFPVKQSNLSLKCISVPLTFERTIVNILHGIVQFKFITCHIWYSMAISKSFFSLTTIPSLFANVFFCSLKSSEKCKDL